MEVEVHKPPDGGGDSHPTGWSKPGVGGRKIGGEDCLPGSQGSVAMVLINSVGSGEAGLERRDPSGEVGGDKNQTVAVDARQVTWDGEVQLRSLEAKEGDDRMRLVERQKREIQAARQADLTKRIMEAAEDEEVNILEHEYQEDAGTDWQHQGARRHRKDKIKPSQSQ